MTNNPTNNPPTDDNPVFWVAIDGSESISHKALSEALDVNYARTISFGTVNGVDIITVVWHHDSPSYRRTVTYRKVVPEDCPDCGTTNIRRDADGTCLTCAFWTEQFATPGGLIINGNHYRIGDEPTPEEHQRHPEHYGFYGRRYTIRRNDGTVTVTHNLWHQGAIPARLTRPDNATFIRPGDPDYPDDPAPGGTS
jgi:hypothetical protein